LQECLEFGLYEELPKIWADNTHRLQYSITQPSCARVLPLNRMSRRQNIKKLQDTKASSVNLQAVLQGLPHAVLVADGNNRIVFANLAAEVFFGSSELLLKKRSLSNLTASPNPFLNLAEQVRKTGAAINDYGMQLSMAGPVREDVDVFASLVSEDEDLVLFMLQKRSVAHMFERQLTHRGAARSVSGMAAVLAHEIKNPLSGIRGAAQLLEAGASEEDRPLARLIMEETDRIRKLVDRMEVFGDERPFPKEPVNIHAVLDHVRKVALAGFGRGLTIAQVYDPSLPPVPGDRDKLIQVFLNLVKNSAEAIGDRPDGQITLTTAFRPGLSLRLPSSDSSVKLPLEICVTDNGSGVPDDVRPHLFEPFVTTKTQGAGLGLALVAKIVGDHGGVIECESRGRLTTFRTLLPMYQPSSRKTGAK